MMPYIVILNTHSVIPNAHSVIQNAHSVILNAVKNLEVSEAVEGSTTLEILRYTQDDIEPTLARGCFALLSMTY
jgi:hypothetical protein